MECIERFKFSNIKDDDDLFVNKIKKILGQGSEDDHFHLGFTSKKLLKRMVDHEALDKAVFHLDATYKIVRFNYPLIVFGYTDKKHQFFPVSFMFTSHEKQQDYLHFLQ